jgi:hypothetical protein
MMKSSDPIVKEVEGGQFQARYPDSPPNVFGIGDSREAAIKALESKKIAHAAVGSPEVDRKAAEGVNIVQSVEATVDRIVITALPEQRTKVTDANYVAYRESRPEIQGYGADKVKAKAALLQKEFEAGQQEKRAEAPKKDSADKPSKG